MKRILGVFIIVLMLTGSYFYTYSLSIGDIFRWLIGWNYTEIIRSCVTQAIDMNGNIINVQGVYVACESGTASCNPTSCDALRP